MLLDTKIDKLQKRKCDLQEQIKVYKKSLQVVTDELKELEETKEVFLVEQNLETELTIEDLYNKLEEIKASKADDTWITLHVTPLKPEEKDFYQERIDVCNLANRYILLVNLSYDYSRVRMAYIQSMASKDNKASQTSVMCYYEDSEDKNKVDLDTLLRTYIQLRNKYINNDTASKDGLIPMDVYYESKKSRTRVSRYLTVIRQKDDLSLLDEFAQLNSLNICGYYQALNVLNKEQLHELATVIRENKEQVFRWMLSFKWKNQMKAKAEFDMTPVFKLFKKYNVPFRTARSCSGFGKHHWCEFTLDGRMYEVRR